LEESIRRDQRERETKQNAEELIKFLDFDDITEFNSLTTQDFEEKNYFDEDIVSENVPHNESYYLQEELKQDESIQTLLKGLSESSSKKINNDSTQDGSVF